jgi:hypothetical protein
MPVLARAERTQNHHDLADIVTTVVARVRQSQR